MHPRVIAAVAGFSKITFVDIRQVDMRVQGHVAEGFAKNTSGVSTTFFNVDTVDHLRHIIDETWSGWSRVWQAHTHSASVPCGEASRTT